jgi:uncharacterized protein (TIGR00251 family)
MRAMATTVLRVTVKPRSRASELTQTEDGSWLARLKAPPIDGKANAELVALVAREFGVRRADVTIAAGASGRIKRVRVAR